MSRANVFAMANHRFSQDKSQNLRICQDLRFALLLVTLEEDVVLDDLGVELSEDGPVVVDEADKVAGYLRQLPLTQGQAWRNLKVETIDS